MLIVPFIPAHLESIEPHEWLGKGALYENNEFASFVSLFPSYTVIAGGNPVACGGVIAMGKEKYQAWSLMGVEGGKYMTGITKNALKFFSTFQYRRIEAYVRADFDNGNRWANMLGFSKETPSPMKKWGDDGYDYYLYAMVR